MVTWCDWAVISDATIYLLNTMLWIHPSENYDCLFTALLSAPHAAVSDTVQFHLVAAHIEATRWWQCCCGLKLNPSCSFSASTVEIHGLMQSRLARQDAARLSGSLRDCHILTICDLSWMK